MLGILLFTPGLFFFFQQDLHLYLFTCKNVKDRYMKYFLPEYSRDVYSGVPGVQVYTHVSP